MDKKRTWESAITILVLISGPPACSGNVGGTSHEDAAIQDTGPDAHADGANTWDAQGGIDGHEATDAEVDLDSEAPPFTCDPEPTTSPVLGAEVRFHPRDPHPGDTVTVQVKSTILDNNQAPDMDLRVTGPDRQETKSPIRRSGGSALYYYEIPNVQLGDYCVLGVINGAPEVSAKVTVSPRPQGPPKCHGGVFKVVSNHLWTCEEEPEWGNYLVVRTLDQDGNPMPHVTVRLGWVDTTERPLKNEDKKGLPPDTVETDDNGEWHGQDWWPINANGEMVFVLSVDGCASDQATEITTGWWEDDGHGCTYCPNSTTKNRWGHWSNTIVFQLDPNATEACVVPSDHAGQAACPHDHLYHDPSYEACWPVP